MTFFSRLLLQAESNCWFVKKMATRKLSMDATAINKIANSLTKIGDCLHEEYASLMQDEPQLLERVPNTAEMVASLALWWIKFAITN